MDAISPAALAAELVERTMDPEGRSLRSNLPAGSWRSLQPRMAGLGLPAEVIDRFKPGAVALQLASAELNRE